MVCLAIAVFQYQPLSLETSIIITTMLHVGPPFSGLPGGRPGMRLQEPAPERERQHQADRYGTRQGPTCHISH